MDLIRKYLTQIKAQLVGLTISQKLLIGLLGVVMVATIFFTVIFSAKPQMVPLIAQSMSPEEINQAEMVIKGKHDYQVSGDKILVPAEQAYQIRGEMAAAGALPKDLSTAFSKAIRDSSPFMPEAEHTRAWNVALQEELTRYLQSFPYVEDGHVTVAMGQQSTLGRPPVASTATVTLKVKGGEKLTGEQVLAIVDMVKGAVPGMKREDVNVIGDGMHSYHAPSSDAAMPADLLSYKKTMEDDLTAKLYNMFMSMGDVKIAVNVVPDLSVRRQEIETFDPKGTVSKPNRETTHEMTSNEGGGPGGEPGMTSNTSATVGDTSAGGKKTASSTTESTTDNTVRIGSTKEQIILPAGVEWKELTASISVPRSYFVSLYHRMKPDDKADPSDETLQPVIDTQIKLAVARAKNAIGAKTDDQIRVDWFDDTIMAHLPLTTTAAVGFAAGTLPGMVAQYAKQGVLAVVALGALGMMLMMVRRAVPGGADGDVDTGVFFPGSGGGGGKGKKRKGGGVEQLDAADDVFGEANEGEAVLTGIELDDETLQSRKMVDEVSTMIKENPENAAALVKRWMTKNK